MKGTITVQKVIFLVDMNAFFISCEMTRNPALLGKPAAVAGDPQKRTGIVLAANYEARKFGVKTAMVLHKALKLCPDMILVPPDHNFYQKKSNEVMNLLFKYSPIVEKNSIDEAWLDMTGTGGLFGTPFEAASRIMEDIKINLDLWCSIGISENKFLSKMASNMKKPLGITELWQKDIEHKLWPLPVRDMYRVGGKTSDRLNSLGIKTIGDLAKFDKNYIQETLGKSGIELHQYANGLDFSSVRLEAQDDIKSIGRSTTLPEDLVDIDKLKYILMKLSEDVGMAARKHNKKGRIVQIILKFSDFEVITRQTTVYPTCFTNDIYNAGYNLLKKNIHTYKAVRLIGISLGGFEENYSSEQISLFNIDKDDRHEKIDELMDKIRNKYGSEKISRASLIKK